MKIRVLEVLATLRRAGAESMAVSLACGLDRSRFETEVVSLYDPSPAGLEPALAGSGVRVWHLGKRRGFDPRMYLRLTSLLREFRPHVIHTHSYVLRYAWLAVLAAGAGKIVHTVHNLADREVDILGRLLHRLAFRCGVMPVAVGSEVGRSFRELYGFDPAATIPNGIDRGRYSRQEARETWRKKHGFTAEDLLIVSVGRLEPQKNPLGLIEAFARALGGDARCHMLLAGDGSLRETARARARAMGVAVQVHFLGVREDVAELLSASDVFALASHWEGTPVSVMEAAAAGLPVVSTAVGGIAELVEHDATGILVPAGDIEALAGAIESLARDPERRRALGEAAANCSSRFDVAGMIAAYATLFERAARPPS